MSKNILRPSLLRTRKALSTVNRPKPASSGSATTPEVKALPLKEAGAAGSFLLVTFLLAVKRKVTLSAAIPRQVFNITSYRSFLPLTHTTE